MTHLSLFSGIGDAIITLKGIKYRYTAEPFPTFLFTRDELTARMATQDFSSQITFRMVEEWLEYEPDKIHIEIPDAQAPWMPIGSEPLNIRLYRGKTMCINTTDPPEKWVYGYLLVIDEHFYICPVNVALNKMHSFNSPINSTLTMSFIDMMALFEVYPNTVGQCIDTTYPETGIMEDALWEGDVVNVQNEDLRIITSEIIRYVDYGYNVGIVCHKVGNIHDNPELLKEI